MATHSSIPACKIQWTEEPSRLCNPWGHKRVGHNLASKTNVCLCIYVYMYICVHIHICTTLIIYVYVYIHTHTHIHIYNEILLSHRKEWNKAICSNMNGPGEVKWSNSERERQ